jgi:hypothetical protein
VEPVEETVSPDGETVETPDGKVILTFPEGAFTSNTTVSIEAIFAPSGIPQGYSLGAIYFSIEAGAELQKAITICVRYSDDDVAAAGGDPHRLRLAYYDEDAGRWQVLPTTIYELPRTACATTDTLSDWAIFVQIGGGGGLAWWAWLLIGLGGLVLIFILWRIWSRARWG